MKKLKVTATRIDEYEISFDPAIINEQWLKEFGEVFHEVEDLEELAVSLAFLILRFGSGSFVEGFGHVKTLREDGSEVAQFRSGFKLLEEKDYAPGIVLRLITEDDDHAFEIEEVA